VILSARVLDTVLGGFAESDTCRLMLAVDALAGVPVI